MLSSSMWIESKTGTAGPSGLRRPGRGARAIGHGGFTDVVATPAPVAVLGSTRGGHVTCPPFVATEWIVADPRCSPPKSGPGSAR